MKLSEYLDNRKIECSTDLSEDNWKRLLNSDTRILKKLDEWKSYNLSITISSVIHTDSFLRSPIDKGYINYFYDGRRKSYVTYEMHIRRNLSVNERTQYGNNNIFVCHTIDIPLSMCLTVLRSDIQQRKKNAKMIP